MRPDNFITGILFLCPHRGAFAWGTPGGHQETNDLLGEGFDSPVLHYHQYRRTLSRRIERFHLR